MGSNGVLLIAFRKKGRTNAYHEHSVVKRLCNEVENVGDNIEYGQRDGYPHPPVDLCVDAWVGKEKRVRDSERQ